MIGSALRARREAQRLTQEEVAQRLQRIGVDVDRKTISKIETGLRCIADWELWAIAEVLDCSTDALYPAARSMWKFLETTSTD